MKDYPLVVDDSFQSIKKTKDALSALESLGLTDELSRCAEKKIRGTKGKMRGRKYKGKKGPIIIVGDDLGIVKAGRNIPGVDILSVKELDVMSLAPGAHPGRLAVWTESALKSFGAEEAKEKAKPVKEAVAKTAKKSK